MTVTSILQPEQGPRADNQPRRWQPTRVGILNIWRYYDEVFEFHNGRLLLRGPNGSGKSKALEVLLPYLLDASLKPSRLSTFGGSERPMHWNLMGDGYSGATRVGYVWLEFHLLDDDHEAPRWFSCGARLQATANTKSVTPAYFTTSQRIGPPQGLSLTRDGGQPLTRAQLDAAIGNAGRVHETPDSYRTTVRQTLYGGLNEQRYESLLTALRQLRTPKLSERLDPSLLSDLLSSALPPLGEGEIREIAEGFERLDRQREDLKTLDRQVDQAAELAALQRTYARRVLRAGAASVISTSYAMQNLASRVKTEIEQHHAAQSECETAQTRVNELENLEQRLLARIDGLKDREAYRAGKQLDDARRAANTARQSAERSREEAGRHATKAAARRNDVTVASNAADKRHGLRDRASAEASHAAERADMTTVYEEMATRAAESTQGSIHEARQLLRAAVDSRNGQVAQVRSALDGHEKGIERRTEAERDRDESREKLAAATEKRDRAYDTYVGRVEALAQELRDWAHACRELAPLDGDALAERAESPQQVDEFVVAAQTRAAERFATAQSELQGRLEDLSGKLEQRQIERDDLDRKVDLPPGAPATRDSDRSARPGAPLWRLVAFRNDVASGAQASVEAALEAAGLLDAWIMPDGTVLPGERDTFIPAELTRPVSGISLADVLTVEPDSPVPADLVRGLLSGIAYGPSAAAELDHPAAVAADGTWRLAAATGRWSKPEPAHIGATARERARLRRIAELDAEIANLKQEISACETAISDLAMRRDALAAELARRPSHQPVLDAYKALEDAERDIVHQSDNLDRDEERLRGWESKVADALRELTALAVQYRMPTTASALNSLADATRAVDNTASVWLNHCTDVLADQERVANLERTARELEDIAGQTAQRATEDATKAAELAEKLAAVEGTVGVEHHKVLDMLERARADLTSCRTETKSLRKRLSGLNVKIGELGAKVAATKQQQDTAAADRDRAADRFRHLTLSHLPADARVDVGLTADDGVRATLDAARAVAANLDRVPHEVKNLRDAETRLTEAIHRSRDVLSDRSDLELVPDDDIKIFTATMDGVRIGAARLHESLREEREQRQADITDKERDLFDRTLAGDTRRHLADRIRQANELVDGMNQRLERVRTASRVAVRLLWRVDPQQSAGTHAARDLLLKDPADLNEDNRQALYRFFRDRVEEAQATNTAASWEEQLMQVLDYTKWHRFTVRINRDDGNGWQDLTKRTHGALSGGEKAIALHLPLFAAVAAHYQTDPGSPRFILLDEVFVGVDTANRGQVFDLLVDLGLDLVLTSDHEWCDYRELDGIAVHQLITGSDGDDDDAVTTARFIWNGYRIIADDVGTETTDEPGLPLE